MNILLTNTTVFSIKATTNSQEIILLPNQSVNTDCDQKSLIKLSFIFNIFSIVFQTRRIKKLCDVEKIKKLIE